MPSQDNEQRPGQPIEITTGFTARIKEIFPTVFRQGRYPEPIMAMLEFTDNSVGFRAKGRDQKPSEIFITLNRDNSTLSVTDIGGIGGDASSIDGFLQMGQTADIGVGTMGVGAKFAAFYFGNHLTLSDKRPGQNFQYVAELRRFGDPTLPYEQKVIINTQHTNDNAQFGVFDVTISGLKPDALQKLDKLGVGPVAFQRYLGETYRPLLLKSQAAFSGLLSQESRRTVDENGNLQEVYDKVALYVTTSKRAREQIIPLEIPLVAIDGIPGSEELKVGRTSSGDPFGYWFGEMDLTRTNATRGIRLYYDGRLMTIDDFNLNDPALAGLTGEVHLDNIKGIKSSFSMNKSGGVDKENDSYKEVRGTMEELLKPFVEKLRQRAEESKKSTKPLEEILRQSQDLVNNILRDLDLDLSAQAAGSNPPPPPRETKPPEPNEPIPPKVPSERPPTPPSPNPERKKQVRSVIDGVKMQDLPDLTEVAGLSIEMEEGKQKRYLILNSANFEVKQKIIAIIDTHGVRRSSNDVLRLENLSGDDQKRVLEFISNQLLELAIFEAYAEESIDAYRHHLQEARALMINRIYGSGASSNRK